MQHLKLFCEPSDLTLTLESRSLNLKVCGTLLCRVVCLTPARASTLQIHCVNCRFSDIKYRKKANVSRSLTLGRYIVSTDTIKCDFINPGTHSSRCCLVQTCRSNFTEMLSLIDQLWTCHI